MSDVRLQLLGPVELIVDGAPVPLGGARQRALVALLALNRDRTIATNTIVDQVWGTEAPRTVVKSMSTLFSRVRPLLEPHGIQIVHEPAGYHLRAPADCVDVHAFRDAVNRSRLAEFNSDAALAITELRAALDLWRGAPLIGLDGSFVLPAQAGLLLEREAALVKLAGLLQAAGDTETAIELLERLAEQAPLREDRHSELMRALTAGGRSADALAVYDTLHDRLADELGLEPGELLEAARRDAIAPSRAQQLIGRTRELEFLEESLRNALQREMSVVMVSGEPGAGKSRLVEAFVERVAGRGFVTLVGRCEPTGTMPLHPLLQVFEQVTALGLIDPADYPALHLLLADVASDPTGEVGDLRRRLLLNEIATIVLVLGAEGPLIVVIEDFHNADPLTLAVVEATAYEGIELPAILVLTARESELLRQGPSELALAEVATRGNLRHLELSPLSRPEIEELVRRTAPAVAGDPDLLAQVHEGAGGNALYAELLARHLADHAGELGPLPKDILELVRERLLSVPDRGRELLEAASVLGQEFTLDEAGALLGDDQRVRQLRVWEARRSGVLEPVPGTDRHRFLHGIVQRVAYELPTAEVRAELHLAASRLRQDASVGDLEAVHHLLNARPLVPDEEVADRIIGAARRTIEHGAYGSAVRMVELVDGLDLDPARLTAVRVLGGIARVSDGDAAALDDLDAGIAEAKAEGWWDLAAEGLLARTRIGRFVTSYDAQRYADDVAEVIERGDLDELRAGFLHTHQAEALLAVDIAQAGVALSSAERLAVRLDQPALLRRVERLRALELTARGAPARHVLPLALAAFDACVATADHTGAALMAVTLQGARTRAGDLNGCAADTDRLLELTASVGRQELTFLLHAQHVAVTLATEHLGPAEQAVEALADQGRGVSPALVGVTRLLHKWFLRREQLGLAQMEDALRSASARSERPGMTCLLAACLVEQGRSDEAAELLNPVAEAVLSTPFDWGRTATLSLIADLNLELGLPIDLDATRDALRPMAPDLAVLGGSMVVIGRVERYLGRVEWAAGDLDRAVAHLARARELDQAAGIGLWAAWASRDEAVVRRLRGGVGDEEAAVPLLDRALRTAKRHGSLRLARAVQEQF